MFHALFVDGITPLDDEVCVALVRQLALDDAAFREILEQSETAAALAATVEDAARRGVFGVPSFVLGDEIYFGNDRLVLLRQALLEARA